MSEVKPPTSASLREARELNDGPLWKLCDHGYEDGEGRVKRRYQCEECTTGVVALALDSSRRAALGQAAEIAEKEALGFAENEKRCQAAGNEIGASGDMHGALACAGVAAAIRALMEGE